MFEGFTPGAIDFLWGIRFNNNREWFQEHKKEYEENLYHPMVELSKAVGERFHLQGTVLKPSRIYRDVRYAPTPYKEWLWFVIREDNSFWSEHPSLFFQIEPEGGSFGFIDYAPKASLMELHRKRMLEHPREFAAIIEPILETGIVEDKSTRYKRLKEGGRPELERWYQLKNCYVGADIPVGEALFDPKLPDRLAEAFTLLTPLFQYFKALEGTAE